MFRNLTLGGGVGPKRAVTGTGQDTIQKIQQEHFARNPYSSDTRKMAK